MPSPDGSPPEPPDALATVTSTTLLEGLRERENHTVWGLFVERYRPLIVRHARRLGVPAGDAEDVAQASLMGFSRGYAEGRYDRAQGRLRAWLFGIVRNQVLHWQRGASERARRIHSGGDEAPPEPVAPPGEMERMWEEDWREAVLAACLEQLRREVQPQTFEAFRRFALEEVEAETVARELGLTVNAVYGAKRRVLRRLRELQPLMEEIW